METIVIDDLPKAKDNSIHIIDLDEEDSNDEVQILETCKRTRQEQFIDIFKENQVLGEFMEKCIELDSSGGMMRVMKRTLVPIYKATSNMFKESLQFQRALTKVICQIETDPSHKFSHVKDFCDFLRDNVTKKRVTLNTLSKKVRDKEVFKTKLNLRRKRFKRRKLDNEVINLEEEFEVPIINLEEETRQINEVYPESTNELPIVNVEQHINTNSVCTISKVNPNNYLTIDSEKENTSVNVERLKANNNTYENVFAPYNNNFFLEPRYSKVCENEEELAKRVKSIEHQICTFKSILDEMNLAEVTDDTPSSPYLQAEYYQSKIVELYKLLCELTGKEPVKRRQLRLRAVDSRSELPLKKLEHIINSQIESNGLPHFPDFEEVVQCVCEANEEGGLSWDWNRITSEARTLFTYCGKAIQRKRQKREWRDMMTMVKDEIADDPADHDPELAAKLERNRLIAKTKEYEILKKYAVMERQSRGGSIACDRKEMDESDDSDEEIEAIVNSDEQPNLINTISNINPPLGNINPPPLNNIAINQIIVIQLNNVPPNIGLSNIAQVNNFGTNIAQVNNFGTYIAQVNNFGTNIAQVNNFGTDIESNSNNSLPGQSFSATDIIEQCSGLENDYDEMIRTSRQIKTVKNNNNVICDKITNCGSTVDVNNQSVESPMLNVTDQVTVNELSTTDMPKAMNMQNILTESIPDTNRVEVLNIEIENSNGEASPRHSENSCEARRVPNQGEKSCEASHLEGSHVQSDKGTEGNLGIENSQEAITECQDTIKVKVERTAEDVIRDLNEMDNDTFIATVIGIEDPFLIVEISSDSDTEDEDEMESDEDDECNELLLSEPPHDTT